MARKDKVGSVKLDKNSSFVNLTEPELYKYYSGIDSELVNDDQLYQYLQESISSDSSDQDQPHTRKGSIVYKSITAVIKLAILGVAGNVFIDVVNRVHQGNHILPNLSNFKLLFIFQNVFQSVIDKSAEEINLFHGLKEVSDVLARNNKWISTFLNNSVEGIMMGMMQLFLDNFFNVSSKQLKTIDLSLIVRSSVAMIGIAYGLRHVEWTSSLQASLAWCLLNPCLWLLLDGTLSGFLTSSIFAMAISTLCAFSEVESIDLQPNITDVDNLSQVLFVASFFFTASIIFGQLSRWLFK